MAKPKGMYLRGSTWWARKDVPKPLRKIIGQTSLQRTLETSDLSDAKAHALDQKNSHTVHSASA